MSTFGLDIAMQISGNGCIHCVFFIASRRKHGNEKLELNES